MVIVFSQYGPCKQTPLSRFLPQMSHPWLVFYFEFYHPLKINMLSRPSMSQHVRLVIGWDFDPDTKDIKTGKLKTQWVTDEFVLCCLGKSTWRHFLNIKKIKSEIRWQQIHVSLAYLLLCACSEWGPQLFDRLMLPLYMNTLTVTVCTSL